MMKRKWKITILSLLMMFVAFFAAHITFMSANAALPSERLEGSDVKMRVAQTAPQNSNFSDSRKGLKLYAYDSGATAQFKGGFYGTFEAEVKASTENSTKPDLTAYSFIFSDLTSDNQFALTIEDKGTEINAYVSVKGEKTGVFYNVDVSWDGQAHGYTATANQSGTYTRVLTSGTTAIKYDPSTMEISVRKANGRDYTLVWNLSEQIIDGKKFDYVIEEMNLYSVAIEFTSVKIGGKGELTIYNVNGEDYGGTSLPTTTPMIYLTNKENAIVGNEYEIPTPSIYDYSSTLTADALSVEIYDDGGNLLTSGQLKTIGKFTPEKAGNYYVYYYAETTDGTKGEAYFVFTAYNNADASCTFSAVNFEDCTIGLNTSLEIPLMSAESILYQGGVSKTASVAVKKDGAEIDGYSNISSGFTYKFTELGTYTFEYFVTAGGKRFAKMPIVVTVSKDEVGVEVENIESSYTYNTQFTAPEATIYYNGESAKAKTSIVSPNGDVRGATSTLNKAGTWTIEYTYEVGGKTGKISKYFDVEYNVSDLFTCNEKASISFSEKDGNANLPGASLVFTSNMGEMTYDVDLSDNTKDNMLIRLYVVSSTPGIKDMYGFYITLTDKLNRDNYLTIRVYSGDGNMSKGAYVKAKAYNQAAYTAWYYNRDWNTSPTYKIVSHNLETAMNHNYGGYTTDVNFMTNTYNLDMEKTMLNLMYDTDAKSLYCKSAVNYQDYWITDSLDSNKGTLVAKFDDPDEFSSLWTGFTDNSQVELKITPIGVSSSAMIKIVEIDGNLFTKDHLHDSTGPVITVDMEGMTSAPNALVGTAYKIFDITAADSVCDADTLKKTVTVSHDGENVAIENGYFTPNETGEYLITYRVTDGYGNASVRTVPVQSVSSLEAVEIEMTEEWADSLVFGAKTTFPAVKGTGGSGRFLYTWEYSVGGKTYTAENGVFVPVAEGIYTLKITAEDYLGQTAVVTHAYTVNYSSDFIFDESSILLPTTFISGIPYIFSDYTAYYYPTLGKDAEYVHAQIFITDGNGEQEIGNFEYTPYGTDNKGTAIIRFVFEGTAGGATIKKEVKFEIPIKNIEQTKGFMTEYFATENAVIEAKNSYIVFSAIQTSTNVKASFVRSVAADNFQIIFAPYTDTDGNIACAYETIRVTLTDKYDKSIKVTMNITQNGEKLTFDLNGGTKMSMLGSLSSVGVINVQIGYDNSTFELTCAEGTSLGKINYTDDGNAFNGFTSNEVYVDFELVNVTGESSIALKQINNQVFTNSRNDTVSPQIYVDGSYSGMFDIGTVITLPKARAYDVLSATSAATITVKGTDGYMTAKDGTLLNNAPADKEYVVEFTAAGRYTITYYSVDAKNKKTDKTKTIVISDNVLPEIELKKDLPEKVKVGDAVTIPDYKVVDNGDISKATVEIYYTDGKGMIYALPADGKIQVDTEGTYTVYFYVIDEHDNYNVIAYTFTAVK